MLSFHGYTKTNSVDTLNIIMDAATRSLTHNCMDLLSLNDISNELEDIKKRLLDEHGGDSIKLTELNKLLDKLTGFELGRFLIKNKGRLVVLGPII